ncbi:hypothetical protein BU15DRAFT_18323, partial [Melanogaster broomeanus]
SVTGASSGFGRCTTDYLLKQGHRVVATLHKPEALSELGSGTNITTSADIIAAFHNTQEAFGRFDVVFDNAGQMIVGE